MLYRFYVKRVLDIVLSLCAILVLAPLLLSIAMLVWMKLGKPVLFRQKRVGIYENIFTIYKFRTMSDSRDENGSLLPETLRLTKVGKLLRSTSLDELPELFLILKGDMSIVGPRPLLVEYIPIYSKTERQRHRVRPGLTGLAQISGRNYINWDDKLAIDVEYVNRMNFVLDIQIVFKTLVKVLKRQDISTDTGQFESNLAEVRSQKPWSLYAEFAKEEAGNEG